MPYLLHGVSVIKVISERPMIFTFECRNFTEGAITNYFHDLVSTRPVRAGLELTPPGRYAKALPLGLRNRSMKIRSNIRVTG
jgi:hypothetical protein